MAKAGRNSASKMLRARDYIKENMDIKSKKEIVGHLKEELYLKETTLGNAYDQERAYRYMEMKELAREKIKARRLEEEKVAKYKGRERAFFYFDDGSLYKNLTRKGI